MANNSDAHVDSVIWANQLTISQKSSTAFHTYDCKSNLKLDNDVILQFFNKMPLSDWPEHSNIDYTEVILKYKSGTF